MAATSRLSALRALFTAVRIAARPGGPSLWQRLAALPRMVRATATGRYPGITLGRLALIAGAAGYVVSPIDLMPEVVLGVVGLLDDAVVLGWVATQLVVETESFLEWERARASDGSSRAAAGGETVPGHVVR